MRKEKKGHELEREIKTEKERNKAMRSTCMDKHTLSVMDWFVSKSKNLLNQSCLYSWSFPFQQKTKTDMLWGHVCKYVSVIGLIFIGVAFWMENIFKDIKRSHLRVYVSVWYLPGCPRAGRAYPHLHPGWNKTADRDTYESREQTWIKKTRTHKRDDSFNFLL